MSAASAKPQADRRFRHDLVGLWLGLAVFFALLLMPTPSSMQRAAKAQFARDLDQRVQSLLAARGQSAATPDSPEYAAAESAVTRAFAWRMKAAGAVTALIACWWMFSVMPIGATSLLPIVLFPILGVMPIAEATAPYANHNVFLFLGGFVIALGIERWGLHRRIALHVISVVGTRRSTVVLGFMIASAALSMWISNTATAMMMLPIGLAVIAALGEMHDPADTRGQGNFAAALMLGIAYASSIGGVATPIGTPPNIAFRGIFAELYPDGPEIGFGPWMLLFIPLVIVFLPAAWLVLTRIACPFGESAATAGRDLIRKQLRDLGPLRGPERSMLIVFIATALLWMTRSIPVAGTDYGWAAVLERTLEPSDGTPPWFHAAYIKDATVAMGVAVLMFLLPAGRSPEGRPRRLVNWETATRIPWGILLLFGGGFSIAAAFSTSGLSLWAGHVFAESGLQSPLALIAGTCTLLTSLTEVTSNTATTNIMLPVIGQASQQMGVNPLVLMLAATLSASCAFMLPVATPPNAIVFGSGHVGMWRMIRAGFLLNLLGIVLITIVMYALVTPVLGLGIRDLPDWVR